MEASGIQNNHQAETTEFSQDSNISANISHCPESQHSGASERPDDCLPSGASEISTNCLYSGANFAAANFPPEEVMNNKTLQLRNTGAIRKEHVCSRALRKREKMEAKMKAAEKRRKSNMELNEDDDRPPALLVQKALAWLQRRGVTREEAMEHQLALGEVEDNAEWQLQTRKTAAPQLFAVPPLSVANSYEVLEAMETGEPSKAEVPPPVRPVRPVVEPPKHSLQLKRPAKTVQAEPVKEPPAKKIQPEPKPKAEHFPPLVTRGMNTVLFLAEAGKRNVDCTVSTRGAKQTIKTTNKADHDKIKEMLKDSDVGGHSYPMEEERRVSLVLKGLPHEYIDFLKAEIKTLTGIEVDVNLMTTPKSKKGGYKLNVFVVSCPKKEAKTVTEANRIFHHIVKWEALEKSEITRCGRCQQYGHSQRYCYHDPRCVKCDKYHLSSECTAPKKGADSPPAYCHNCKEDGHPASYAGCPIRKELIRRNKDKKQQQQQRHQEAVERRAFAIASATRPIQPGVSWAEMVAPELRQQGQRQQTQKQQQAAQRQQQPAQRQQLTTSGAASLPSFFETECTKLFRYNISDLMSIIHNFIPKYEKSDLGGQQVMFASLLIQICRTN